MIHGKNFGEDDQKMLCDYSKAVIGNSGAIFFADATGVGTVTECINNCVSELIKENKRINDDGLVQIFTVYHNIGGQNSMRIILIFPSSSLMEKKCSKNDGNDCK